MAGILKGILKGKVLASGCTLKSGSKTELGAGKTWRLIAG